MVKCAVIGCGLMGSKIAGDLAANGHRVKVHDTNVDALNSIYKRVEEDRKSMFDEGLIAQNTFPGQILCMSRLEETVEDADFVFEACVENMVAKQEVFEKVARFSSEEAVLCTNSLRLDVNSVFKHVTKLDRTMGVRFLFPVYYVPEVEITPTHSTSVQNIDKVRVLLENMGKTLFYRSGPEPLILTEEQREERKNRRIQEILTHGLSRPINVLPTLGQMMTPRASICEDPGSMANTNTQNPECAICLDRLRDCVLAPCHHLILCSACAHLLYSRHDFCPVCRQQIQDVIRVYHS